jgi:hypothetical protein
MLSGYVDGGNWLYISLLLSPSNPPKVKVGFEGVNQQNERARIQYQSHTGYKGIYLT